MDDFFKLVVTGAVSTTLFSLSTLTGCSRTKVPKKPTKEAVPAKELQKTPLSASAELKCSKEKGSSADQISSIRQSAREKEQPAKQEPPACVKNSATLAKNSDECMSLALQRTQTSERSCRSVASEMNSSEPMMSSRLAVNMDETQRSASTRCLDDDDTDDYFDDLESDRYKSTRQQ